MIRKLRRLLAKPLPASGFAPGEVDSALDHLSDEQLHALNSLVPWKCFTTDKGGRRFGNQAWAGKRSDPQAIPDRRIGLMDARFGLGGRRVLEIGCFEGVHTIGLGLRGAQVIAIDSRVENVAKTVLRCHFYGQHPAISVCNVEDPAQVAALPHVDLVHHVGVLYHLYDPVSHLLNIGPKVLEGMMLDTHVASTGQDEYSVAGRHYAFARYREQGLGDVFSGMSGESRWLTLDSLKTALGEAGFSKVDVQEHRKERNGDRVLIFASRH
jgi:tRNA (mo5U34)-methyltransferase